LNPEFLDIDDVLEIHGQQMAEHGGSEGIRDLGLLDSAVAQPMAQFSGQFLNEDLFEMAAALMFRLCRITLHRREQTNRASGNAHVP
jgi:death on curing protein